MTRMRDNLVTSLRFTRIRDYELAWVEADLILPATSDTQMSNSADLDGAECTVASMRRDQLAKKDSLPVLVAPEGPVGRHKTVFLALFIF
ncbi:unnamed protein product [Protopolystoma xenopodis]|uniref:Uncharacterized protein n=1 Tax=Protopolystoma xenopodis TaxID=117903 RepID=A0A3S5ATY0_9PLAT|nr:unnamed protein product [Protopolystoma xenopodis]